MLKLIFYFVTSEIYSMSSVSLLKIIGIANRLDYLVLKKVFQNQTFCRKNEANLYTCVSIHECSGKEVSKMFE